MTNRPAAVVLSVTTLIAAVTVAAWLLLSGHIAEIHGLMLVKAGLLAAIVFTFRLAEYLAPSVESLWGPARTYFGDRG